MLGKMQAQLVPTHQAVVWDGGLAAERLAELPGYKQQRPPMPGGLEQQLPGIAAWLGASGCASLVGAGVEADDWIASLARRAVAEGLEVVIATSDKDFMQLVGTEIGLLNPNDKSEKIWKAEDVQARTGVNPAQVVDWLSLIGDAVDNIPGVPGVGPKTATELLRQFGSVDVLFARLAEDPRRVGKSDRLRTSLRESEPVVRRNQRLIRLGLAGQADEAGPGVPLDALKVQPPDMAKLRSLYAEWGFKSLLASALAGQAVASQEPEQGTLW